MAYRAGGAENFEISHVISRAFAAIGANPLLYLVLSLFLTGIPSFGLAWWQGQVRADAVAGPGLASVALTAGYWIPVIATLLAGIVTGAVLQAALTRATVLNLAGERPAFGPSLAVGLSLLPATAAIGLLTTFAYLLIMILAMIPLILLMVATPAGPALAPFLAIIVVLFAAIPVILLWLRWSVAVPAYVQERIGVFESFSRSNRLTKDARGKVFLTLLVVVIGAVAFQYFAGLLGGAIAGLGYAVVTTAAVTGLSAAVTGMVSATISASIYVELRDVKEGVEPNELETIFA